MKQANLSLRRRQVMKIGAIVAGAPQRWLTLTRGNDGATRAAFEMTLAPRNALASLTPNCVAL